MATKEVENLISRINQALDDVRPHLEADGGNVEIVELTEDFRLRIKWIGNCENCFMSAMTMKAGIEHTIRSKVPEIKAVEAVNGVDLPF